jgi:hypothetical protein
VSARFLPSFSLARRIAADIGAVDPADVYGAIQRRAPGLVLFHARGDELSKDQYEDLCFAVESELGRPVTRRVEPQGSSVR